ncbi:hypothetical protein VNO77_06660 [Canavalia gladiata]|uniref:Uncharacterized protein n=1 Tax=Canavalia gladiata TaxID=3824 RepID=A0AAN9R061_CANGL
MAPLIIEDRQPVMYVFELFLLLVISVGVILHYFIFIRINDIQLKALLCFKLMMRYERFITKTCTCLGSSISHCSCNARAQNT